jgi:tetratricopeptide (TPR) repeat protein
VAIQQALGVSGDTLNDQFQTFLGQRLARYDTQFVPVDRPGDLDELEAKLRESPKDAALRARAALAYLQQGDQEKAEKQLSRALELNPAEPNALYLRLQIAQAKGNASAVKATLAELDKHQDGYMLELAQAEMALAERNVGEATRHFRKAHEFDPTQSEPLAALLKIARHGNDEKQQIELLTKLIALEEHAGGLFAELLQKLIAAKRFGDAVKVGQSAIWADLSSFDLHRLYGEALAGSGQPQKARFEWESALLCDAADAEKAKLRQRLSGG